MPAKKRYTTQTTRVTRGSGNVFADLGLPHSEELLAKADLAIAVTQLIQERGLTQREAAQVLGIDQPKVSKIMRGVLTEFSTERLMQFVTRLGRDVEIRVKRIRGTRPGQITVAA